MTRQHAADLIQALPLHTPFEDIQVGDIVVSDCDNLPEDYRFSADTAVGMEGLIPLVVERIDGDKTVVRTLGGTAYTVGTPSMLLVYSPRVMADGAQAPSISEIVEGIKAFDYWRGASAWEKGDKRRIYFSGGNIWNTRKVKVNAFLEFEECKVTLKIWVDSSQPMAWKESQKNIVADQLEYAAAFAAAVWNCAHIVEDAASAEDAATPDEVVVVDDLQAQGATVADSNRIDYKPWLKTKQEWEQIPVSFRAGIAIRNGVNLEKEDKSVRVISKPGIGTQKAKGGITVGGYSGNVYDTTNINLHKEIIKVALANGETVPAEVLAEYPDLQPQSAAVAVTPEEVSKIIAISDMSIDEYAKSLGKNISEITLNEYKKFDGKNPCKTEQAWQLKYQIFILNIILNPDIKSPLYNLIKDVRTGVNIFCTKQKGDKSGEETYIYVRGKIKEIVKQALANGETVPAEVLAEYADLQPQGAAVAATPEDVVVVDDVAEETKTLEAEKMDKVEVFINELAKKMADKKLTKAIKDYGSIEELEIRNKISYKDWYNQRIDEYYIFYTKAAKNIQEGNVAKFSRTINSLNPEVKKIYNFITGDKLPDTEKGVKEYFRKKYPEYYIALENEKKTNSVIAPTQTFADYRIKPDTMQSPQKVAAENMNPTPTIVSEMLLPSLDGMKAHAKNVTITEWVERRKASGTSLPLSQPERNFVAQYTGGGGLNESGYGKGVLSEYYTPYEVVKVMVELANHYGYKSEPNTVLEPSCGTGRFLAHFPQGGEAYEISPISQQIAAWLYPQFDVKLADFSTKFTDARKHFPVKEQYNLVIGNPPYGKFDGFYAPAEKRVIDTDKVEEYFMARCLDVLKPGGLLVFIIGCEPKNGGIPFLRKSDSKVKQRIAKAADLLCAYRIPPKLFPTTDVMSEIIVLRKK